MPAIRFGYRGNFSFGHDNTGSNVGWLDGANNLVQRPPIAKSEDEIAATAEWNLSVVEWLVCAIVQHGWQGFNRIIDPSPWVV